jgi:hypothetical protein
VVRYVVRKGMVTVNNNRLMQRKNTWYFRAMVPADLHVLFGKQEVRKSLGTSNKYEARQKATPLSLEFDAKVDALRREMQKDEGNRRKLSDLSMREIDLMVIKWLKGSLQEISPRDHESGKLPRHEALEELRIDEQDLIDHVDANIDPSIDPDMNVSASISNQAKRIMADNSLYLECQ